MSGMIQQGQAQRQSALSGLTKYANQSSLLDAEAKRMDQANEAQRKSTNMQYGAMGGMAAGAYAGSQMGTALGPYGTVVGAAIGGLIGMIGGDLW